MPDWTDALQSRLGGLRLHPAREAEIIEELTLHLEDRYEELRRSGLDDTDACHLALAELSDDDLLARGMRRLKQAHARELIVPGLPRRGAAADIWQDVRYATRMLRKQPGFTASAVLTLALGIGANTAIFSLINATLLQRLPVADSEQLLYVHNGSAPGAVFSYPEYAELRDRNDVFDGFIAWGGIAASLNADGATDIVGGAIVSGDFFELLGVQAALGRTLARSDDVTPGAHPVAVISHGLWQTRFGARADIVGHAVLLNGQPFTIVGVMGREFGGAQLGVIRNLYVPMMMQPLMRPPRAAYSGEMNPDLLRVRGNRWLFAIGRLKPGMTKEGAEASLSGLATAIDVAAQPSALRHPIGTTRVDEGTPGQRAQMVPVATLLMCVVGAVLLIACVNVANLLLSRAISRRREIAVRLAIGASRWRLVRQFLTESVLLATIGGTAGVLLAWLVVRGFRAAPPPAGALPVALDFSVDVTVLAFSAALSIITGIVFGLAPALRASRPSLVPALKGESFASDERGRRVTLKKALVVIEVALSLALLITAGLFVRSFLRTQAIDPGFDVARLVNAPLNINLLRYTRDQGRDFYARVVERVAAIPGVESATIARLAPLGGGRLLSLQIEGRASSDNQFLSEGARSASGRRVDSVNGNVVGPRYFETMGIARLRGRDFSSADTQDSPPVVIVNRAFADIHFSGGDARGKRISVTGPQGPWREIVGVVGNATYLSLLEDTAAIAYLPLSQNHETGVTLHVRTTVAPEAVATSIRREVQMLEPNLPVPNVQPMTDAIGASLYTARMGAWLLVAFGVLALVLASVGVYGVLAFAVSRRTRELGIRMALGANARMLFALALTEGMTLVLAGTAIGLVGAAFAARALGRFLYGVSTTDAVTFVGVPLILVFVALMACLVPARRATRINPTVALRDD